MCSSFHQLDEPNNPIALASIRREVDTRLIPRDKIGAAQSPVHRI